MLYGAVMCRALAYIGQPIELSGILFDSPNSLSKQAYEPKLMNFLNLAGTGVIAWQKNSVNSAIPYIHRSLSLPDYDFELSNLCQKLKPDTLITHLRGSCYRDPLTSMVSMQNVHPFIFPKTNIAFAHNGFIDNFSEIKREMVPFIKNDIYQHIHGSTDSEILYALYLSFLENPENSLDLEESFYAVEKIARLIREIHSKNRDTSSSSINLFISDEDHLMVTRLTIGYGYPSQLEKDYGKRLSVEKNTSFFDTSISYLSLWYNHGDHYGNSDVGWHMKKIAGENTRSIMIASEPLSKDLDVWNEVPPYSALMVNRKNGFLDIKLRYFNEF